MTTLNPYQAPQGELIQQDDNSVGEIRFFSPSCRIGRLRYWTHYTLAVLVVYVVVAVGAAGVAVAFSSGSWAADIMPMVVVFGMMLYVPLIVVWWIMMIQRLHDLNQSGWLSLLAVVPLANFAFFLYIAFWPGTAGTNRFGPKPPPNRWWHWIVVGLMVVAMIGVLAAIALPAYQDYVLRAQAVRGGP